MAISAATYALLEGRRDTIIADLNAMTSSSVGGKADTTQPGAAKHVAWKDGLYRELREINLLLQEYDVQINGGGEVISEGCP